MRLVDQRKLSRILWGGWVGVATSSAWNMRAACSEGGNELELSDSEEPAVYLGEVAVCYRHFQFGSSLDDLKVLLRASLMRPLLPHRNWW